LNGGDILDEVIPGEDDDFASVFTDHSLAREDCNSVVARIPIELIYYLRSPKSIENQFRERKLLDYPVWTRCSLINVFEGLAGHRRIDFSEYIEEQLLVNSFFDDRVSSDHSHHSHKRMLNTDLNVYKNMSRAFDLDRGFFLRHPTPVEWANGRFGITDGWHRTLFQMSRGIRFIPCRLSKADYETWLNRPVLSKALEYFRANNIRSLPTPVPHGYFYYVGADFEDTYRTRLERIGRYIYENDIIIKGKTVLDFKAGVGHFAQSFFRTGARVYALEPDKKYAEILKLFNELLYCDGIDIKNSPAEIGNVCDISLLIDFTRPVRSMDKDEMSLIDRMTGRLFFYETTDGGFTNTLRAGSSFKYGEILTETLKFGEKHYLYAFRK
jgi:hypothetical protein